MTADAPRNRPLCRAVAFCVLAAGCQAPPARPAACNPDAELPRRVIVARQVLADTAVYTAEHPRRSAQIALTEPLAHARDLTVGTADKCRTRPVGSLPTLASCRPTLDPTTLDAELTKVTGEPLHPAAVALQIDGNESLAALESVIAAATGRLDVLMYLWDDQPLGREIAGRLAAKAGLGLRVRVLVDGGGNLLQADPKQATAAQVNSTVCWLTRQPYVEVVRTRDPYSHFDHRKLVVADGRLAWSGGRNFTQSAFCDAHDLTYTLTGPLAGQMAAQFEEFWRDQGGTPAPPLPPAEQSAEANACARVVRTRSTEWQLEHSIYLAVARARHHVYVENPYFSDSRLQLLLAEARRRGADVRVVLTLSDDSEAVNHANRVVANRLLKAGVRVYVYPGMTHAKALAVDGVWTYFGTGNFDPLSFRHNRELGLAVGGGPFIAELESRLFLADFRPEWELTAPLPLTPLDHLLDFLAGTFF